MLQHIYSTFKVPCEKSKAVSFSSSEMKKIVVIPVLSKFDVKLIYWIALWSASRACYFT